MQKLLSYFSKALKDSGFSTVIHVPVNSTVSAIKLAIKGGLEIKEALRSYDQKPI